MNVWDAVAERRRSIAAWAEALPPEAADAPSWCAGWRVRDVLGHLVHLAEASQVTMARDLLTHGVLVDRGLARMAKEYGDRPVAELAERLAAAQRGRFRVLGTPPPVALGELIVHGADMDEALAQADTADTAGASIDAVDPAAAASVLATYWRVGRLAFHRPRLPGVTLAATDADWSAGTGPEVQGTARDLVLLLANRGQVVPRLSGPGIESLAAAVS